MTSTLGSHLCQSDLNYQQNGSGPLDNETITTGMIAKKMALGEPKACSLESGLI
jgi:hypothetical protein